MFDLRNSNENPSRESCKSKLSIDLNLQGSGYNLIAHILLSSIASNLVYKKCSK
jgi:hypothetical protein